MVGENWVIGKEGAGASSPVDDSAADVSSDDDVSAVGDSVLDASSTDIDSAVGTSGSYRQIHASSQKRYQPFE